MNDLNKNGLNDLNKRTDSLAYRLGYRLGYRRTRPVLELSILGAIALTSAVFEMPSAQAQTPKNPASPAPSLAQAKPLPRLVDRAVRADAVRRSTAQVTPEQLRIVEHRAEIWPNGCLGLSRLDEVCTQGLVSGWRVRVNDGVQTWTYRTNASGQNLRLEPAAVQPSRGAAYNPRPAGRNFIGGDSTSTAPLPEEQQLASAQLRPLGGQVRITLINRTNATLGYQVIGDTNPRQLGGQQSVTLRLLEIPTTVTFRREDAGLLTVLTRVQPEPHGLEVFLDAAVDLSLDRTTLTVERSGEVFLN